MIYHSTRDKNLKMDSAQAVLDGLAPDGGLYVPKSIPAVDQSFISALIDKEYSENTIAQTKDFIARFYA